MIPKLVVEAQKPYGMILADNVLHELDVITGLDLEVVDTSVLVDGPQTWRIGTRSCVDVRGPGHPGIMRP